MKVKKNKDNQYIAWCITGLEKFAIDEIKSLIKKPAKIIIPGRLLIECEEREIYDLIYNTHSLIYIYQLLEQSKIHVLQDIKQIAKKINFKDLIKQNFIVKCERQGTHNYHSVDLERELGAFIHETTDIPVDLHNPTTTIFVDVLEQDCFIGIDLTGQKLSKRDYRVKLIPTNLNPCLAFTLLQFANWNPKEFLLDPFTKSGEIVIEAALYADNLPPQKHILNKLAFTKLTTYQPKIIEINKKPKKDEEVIIYASDEIMANIRNTEINSKLAGVNKKIKFSRIDTEWLDFKFEKNSISKIISYPPQISQTHSAESLEKTYEHLFFNAKNILKKSGSIVLLSNSNLELINRFSAQFKFKVTNALKFNHANHDYIMLELKKA